MNLHIYKRPTHSECPKASDIRQVRISATGKYACFNVCATEELKIQTGMRVLFAQDTDTKQWYFAYGFDLSEGAKVRHYSKRENSMRCSCKYVAALICQQCNTESATFGIAKTPKVIDDLKWYRILTATPIRVK